MAYAQAQQKSDDLKGSIDVDSEYSETDIEVSTSKELSKKEKEGTWIKALRTYKSDIQEALSQNKGSLTRIVLAERKRRDEKLERKKKTKESLQEKSAPSFFERVLLWLHIYKTETKGEIQGTIEPTTASTSEAVKKDALKETQTEIQKIQDRSAKAPEEPLISVIEVKEDHAREGGVATFRPVSQRSASLLSGLDATLREKKARPTQEETTLGTQEEAISLRGFKGPRKILAESYKDGIEEVDEQTSLFRKNIIVIISSVLLLVIGVSLAYGVYLLITKDPQKRPLVLSEIIIVAEKQIKIPLSNLSRGEIERVVKGELEEPDLSFNDVEGIYFTKGVFSLKKEEVSEPPQIGLLGVRELFFILKNKMPPGLLRAIHNEDYLFGVHQLQEKQPFLILKIESFENAFSGMLKWERFMFDDVTALFALDVGAKQIVSQSFEDVVIKNRDARVLQGGNGEAVLLYSFVDRETIVITTNEVTFDEVVNRLKAPKKIIR